MKATIEESKFGFYIILESETLEEGAVIARCGLNRNATPATYVSVLENAFRLSLSYKKTPNDSNYIKPVWSKS